MAVSDIDIRECGYSLYRYPIVHSGTKGQYIPILVIEIPYSSDELDSSINFTNVTGNYAIKGNDLGLNTSFPMWSYIPGNNDQNSRNFLEIYSDDNILISLNVTNESVTGTGSVKTDNNVDIIMSPSQPLYTDASTSQGFLFLLEFLHTYDDQYMTINKSTYLILGDEVSFLSLPVSGTSKGSFNTTNYEIFDSTHIIWYKGEDIDSDIRKLLNLSKIYDSNDPNNGSGDSTGNGGDSSDDIGGNTHTGGTTPTISPLDSGLMTLYSPNVVELQQLGKFLWSDSFDINTFKKLFNDPFDTLLGLSIVPIKPTISGTHNIIFGNLDSGVSSGVVANPWVDVECGSLTLNEVWHGALDYSPYTQVSIYLPFIGVKQLNTNDVMGSTLTLTYHFDVLTGSCIAEIAVNHTSQGNKGSGFSYNSNMGTVYTFSGQCSVNVPLASLDYTNTIRAAIEAVGFTAGAAASFAAGHPALGIASLAVGTANAEIKQATPVVERSGSLGLSSSFMASLEPCLIVSRSHICKPEKYYSLRGVPSQVYVSALSKASGFIQIADTNNLKVSGANDTELTEIKNLLTQGVYVKTWRTKKEQETLEAYSDLDIQLYNNKSAKNQIDKSLSGIRSGDNKLSGTFRDSCDFDNPVVQLRINDVSDLDKCNYMYIGKFNRYYYVTKIVSMRNHIVEISGHVDVLMTYEYYIGTNEAILARSSQVGSGKYGNTYLDDSLMASYNDTYNVCYNWGYSFDHANDSLILAVAGASQS